MTKIEQMANEISKYVYPPQVDNDASDAPRQALAEILMEFALEIKRAATEGEW